MKEYSTDRIKNVGIVAHGSAGKTSLAEALLFSTGITTRLGKVEDGTTVTDFEPEEIKRKVTISAALAPCEWKDTKINFVDTPGYSDFVAEVKGTLRAVDTALVVLCAHAGVEVNTEKVWEYAEELNLPRIAFINKMDREHADFFAVMNTMKEKLGTHVIPFQIPIGSEDSFKGVIDLVHYDSSVVPEELLEQTEGARMELIEAAAEGDDELLTKYLDGEELTEDEIVKGLIKGIANATLFPVFCGSAVKNIGVKELMDAIVEYIPGSTGKEFIGMHPITKAEITRDYTGPFAAQVFKTTADPFVGRLSFIRILSGQLKPDSTIYNASKDKSEKLGNIFTMRGKQQEILKSAAAGDICVVAKLQETNTGDTLCDKENPIIFNPINFPKPMFTMCVTAKNKNEDDKLGPALSRLMDEDSTFLVTKNTETGQLLMSGMGELHVDILAERMKRKFGVDVKISNPKVPYRETIRSAVKVEGKHKKQSGGHGQYGHVWLQIEPLPGGKFEFKDSIFGGAVPKQYIPAVEKGVKDAMLGGILAGYPLVDIKVTLTDGSYHTVDSSEMAFKIASAQALKKGTLQAKPVLLEPIYDVEVIVPESYMGDIIGDLNSKRGRILGMEPIGKGMGRVKAQVPIAEMFRYSIDLRSLTQGRGSFDMCFAHYEEVPDRIAESIIANTKVASQEE